MNYAGCKRKFKIPVYVARIQREVEEELAAQRHVRDRAAEAAATTAAAAAAGAAVAAALKRGESAVVFPPRVPPRFPPT